MSLTDKEIFTAQRLPIRLCADQAAALLNFKPYDIPVLVQARLLKPLGSPAPNSPKFFSTAEVQELAADRAWLDKATKAVAGNWRKRNENAHHRFRHDAAKQAANALKNGNPASEASEAE